ncbi:MAG: LysE family translocator [Desulfobacteraceae bacterium]
MMEFLFMGVVLGFYAGIAPGPLLTFTISETLQYDVRSGMRVALAPIATDAPIIAIAVFVLSRVPAFHTVLGVMSLMGGIFVFYLGWESMRTRGVDLEIEKSKSRSFIKGVVVNALNPHPYLFWFSVGAPIILKAVDRHRLAPLAFVGSFYLLLLGSKMSLVVLVGRFKSFLSGKIYLYTMRFLGIVLWALALVLFRDGLRLLEAL